LTPVSMAENAASALRSSSPFILPNPFADSTPELPREPDSGAHTALLSASEATISSLPLSFPQRSIQSTPSEARPTAPSRAPSSYLNIFALSPNMDLSGLNHSNLSGPSLNPPNEALGVSQRSPNTWSEASFSASSWADGEAAPSESEESHLAFSIGSWSDDGVTGEGRQNLNENVSDSSSPSHHSISDLEHRPGPGGPHVMSDWESVGSPSASEDGR